MEVLGPIILAVLVLLPISIGCGAVLSGLLSSKREFEAVTRTAAENGLNPYAQSGVWGTSFILVTTQRIELFRPGSFNVSIATHVTLERSAIIEIARLMGGALRFKHTDISVPLSIFFSPWDTAELMAALAARGYPVAPATLKGA